MDIATTVTRLIIIAFVAMLWTFILLPLLDMLNAGLGATERLIGFILVPIVGLISAQLLIRALKR